VPAIDDLITEFARLPGIGRKTAARLTYFLLKQPANASQRLASTIELVTAKVGPCGVCGNLSEADPCEICEDPRRDSTLLCVVEEASDISSIERTGEYRGHYHVLGGRLSPLDGVGPDDLRLSELGDRLSNGSAVREVIVATNPSMEGEATATLVREIISNPAIRVSRIAQGLPVGGDLEYADAATVSQALVARREMPA
jgi:recombination protein RecR